MEELVVSKNRVLNESELAEALPALYDMERRNYTTNRLIAGLDEKIRSLAIPKKFSPIDETFVPQTMHKLFRNKRSLFYEDAYKTRIEKCKGVFLPLFGILYVTIIIWLIVKKVELPDFLDDMNNLLALLIVFGGVAILVYVFVLLLAVIIWELNEWDYQKRVEQERQAWEAQYLNPQKAKRNWELDCDRKRVQQEEIMKQRLIAEREALAKVLKSGQDTIHAMYESAGIGVDYRKLIPMHYMDSFFSLGISHTLEGTNGLYYLVRQELRADQFHASLQEISTKLDTLISKQTDIYREICNMNRNVQRLLSDLIDATESVASAVTTAAENATAAIKASTRTTSAAASYISSQLAVQNSYLGISVFQNIH